MSCVFKEGMVTYKIQFVPSLHDEAKELPGNRALSFGQVRQSWCLTRDAFNSQVMFPRNRDAVEFRL